MSSAASPVKVTPAPQRLARAVQAAEQRAKERQLDALAQSLRDRLAARLGLTRPQSLEIGRVLRGHRHLVLHFAVTHHGIPVLGPTVVATARLDEPENVSPHLALLPLPKTVTLPNTTPGISANRAADAVAALEPQAPQPPQVQKLAIAARIEPGARRGHRIAKPRIVGYDLVYLVAGNHRSYRVDAHSGAVLD